MAEDGLGVMSGDHDRFRQGAGSMNSILGGKTLMRESGKLIDRIGESEPVTAGKRV
jgi:hypothetical protein